MALESSLAAQISLFYRLNYSRTRKPHDLMIYDFEEKLSRIVLPDGTVVLHTDLKDLCEQAAVAIISVCRSTGKLSHTGQKLASLDSDLFLGALLDESMYTLFTEFCLKFHHSLASSCSCRQPQMMQRDAAG